MMLLFGGTDTTIAAIGHAMRHLAEHPEDRARLIDEPQRIPAAIEEFIRLHSPSTGVARTVTKPVEIEGTQFEPGDRVLCAINSANRDEAVFVDAESFDLDRPKRPHLAFGWGMHACLGQNLARADLRIFLTEILERLPDFQVDLGSDRALCEHPAGVRPCPHADALHAGPAARSGRRLAGADRAASQARRQGRMRMDADTCKSNDWIDLLALVARYSRGLDTKNYALFRSCFVEPIHVVSTSRRPCDGQGEQVSFSLAPSEEVLPRSQFRGPLFAGRRGSGAERGVRFRWFDTWRE